MLRSNHHTTQCKIITTNKLLVQNSLRQYNYDHNGLSGWLGGSLCTNHITSTVSFIYGEATFPCKINANNPLLNQSVNPTTRVLIGALYKHRYGKYETSHTWYLLHHGFHLPSLHLLELNWSKIQPWMRYAALFKNLNLDWVATLHNAHQSQSIPCCIWYWSYAWTHLWKSAFVWLWPIGCTWFC